jgi:hypothetical protein
MGQPIEDAAKHALKVSEPPSEVDCFGSDVTGEAGGYPPNQLDSDSFVKKSVGYTVKDVVPELLRAQADFIAAQHKFMHSQDLSALVEAQKKYSEVQAHCIVLLDTGSLASIQEQMIGLYTDALRKMGVT